MPAYLYTTDDGETVERWYLMGRAPQTIKVRRQLTVGDAESVVCVVATRDIVAEHRSARPHKGSIWPLKSDAMGVPLQQIDEAEAHSRAIGVPTTWDRKTGQAEWSSRSHRKRYCLARNYHDQDGGYGDP